MEKIWNEMYEAAKSVLNERRISEYVTCGEVSAAVLSKSGKIYTVKYYTERAVPDSVASIGYCAFCDCLGLESITIENPECEIYDSEGTISDTAKIYGYDPKLNRFVYQYEPL